MKDQLRMFDLPHDALDAPFPALHAEVLETQERKTPYLKEPGVALIAKPDTSREGFKDFLDGFHPSLEFEKYLEDPTPLDPATSLVMGAGQLCYMSFGPKRTMNADALKYFDNILASGHGSVLEHANYSFLFYGISRSLTHELVRHRAGFGFSQVSQRYVDGSRLRFVCRPEWAEDPELLELFEERIDTASDNYEDIAGRLLQRQEAKLTLLEKAGVSLKEAGFSRTDLRKQVNQAARACLPNETEAPCVVTANARALRHFFNMRGGFAAEPEIRRLTVKTASIMLRVAPTILQDVEIRTDPFKGDYVFIKYPKV